MHADQARFPSRKYDITGKHEKYGPSASKKTNACGPSARKKNKKTKPNQSLQAYGPPKNQSQTKTCGPSARKKNQSLRAFGPQKKTKMSPVAKWLLVVGLPLCRARR